MKEAKSGDKVYFKKLKFRARKKLVLQTKLGTRKTQEKVFPEGRREGHRVKNHDSKLFMGPASSYDVQSSKKPLRTPTYRSREVLADSHPQMDILSRPSYENPAGILIRSSRQHFGKCSSLPSWDLMISGSCCLLGQLCVPCSVTSHPLAVDTLLGD